MNIGWGEDLTIRELGGDSSCRRLATRGALTFDHSKPDGTPRKLLDVSRLTEPWLASPHIAAAGYRRHLRLVQRARLGRATVETCAVNRDSRSAFFAKCS